MKELTAGKLRFILKKLGLADSGVFVVRGNPMKWGNQPILELHPRFREDVQVKMKLPDMLRQLETIGIQVSRAGEGCWLLNYNKEGRVAWNLTDAQRKAVLWWHRPTHLSQPSIGTQTKLLHMGLLDGDTLSAMGRSVLSILLIGFEEE